MSYMDMSFCAGSKEGWGAKGRSICKNTKCKRHACHIPFDSLPVWEVFTVTDFSGVCGEYIPDVTPESIAEVKPLPTKIIG